MTFYLYVLEIDVVWSPAIQTERIFFYFVILSGIGLCLLCVVMHLSLFAFNNLWIKHFLLQFPSPPPVLQNITELGHHCHHFNKKKLYFFRVKIELWYRTLGFRKENTELIKRQINTQRKRQTVRGQGRQDDVGLGIKADRTCFVLASFF